MKCNGRIKSTGPRYCPSVEDKINRFAEKERHQIFVEPEGWNTVEIYVNGDLKASTSLTLPTTAGTVLFPAVHLAQRVGSAADTLHVDYIRVCQER